MCLKNVGQVSIAVVGCHCIQPVACPIARRLLKGYHRATIAAREAAEPLLAGMRSSDPAFTAASELISAANQTVLSARREYWEHVQEHGCRIAGTTNSKSEIEERLRRDMLEARTLFDRAVGQHDYLVAISKDLSQSPDGGFAHEQATQARVRAYTLYQEALRRYADYAMLGELPEDREAGPSEQSKPN